MSHQNNWLSLLQGKTIRGVRPTHDNGPVPDVNILFVDGTVATISVKDGVFFESCFVNTLRKSAPIVEAVFLSDGLGSHVVEVRARTFPLIRLGAVNKSIPSDEFPFILGHKANG